VKSDSWFHLFNVDRIDDHCLIISEKHATLAAKEASK
jgi:hypothetical protein